MRSNFLYSAVIIGGFYKSAAVIGENIVGILYTLKNTPLKICMYSLVL